MSSRLSPCACRTVPFCRDDQSWVELHLGYPWWNVSQHCIQKLLPQQIAAPYVACIYSFFFFLFPPLLILNVILETVVLGLVLPGVCALGNICPGPENFQSAWIPWCERMGNRGMCPASPGRMMMGIWGNAWPSPAAAALSHPRLPVWFLPDSPLSAFNPGTRSRFPLRACFTPPFLRQEVREAKPDRWEQSLVSGLHLQFSPGRTGCSSTCHPQTSFLCFISAHLKLAGDFRGERPWTFCILLKQGQNFFWAIPLPLIFFSVLLCLFYRVKHWVDQ